MLRLVSTILASYLLGAVPAGVIISRRLSGIDVRRYGSGKTGTANVLRTAGKKAAVATGASDILKGALAVLLVRPIAGADRVAVGALLLDVPSMEAIAGFLAVVGHNWSVFLSLGGGSGLATFLGALAVMDWTMALLGGGLLVLVAGLTRYVSLGSLIGSWSAFLAAVSLAATGIQPVPYAVFPGLASGLILFKHRDNIRRLKSGTERKLGRSLAPHEPLVPRS